MTLLAHFLGVAKRVPPAFIMDWFLRRIEIATWFTLALARLPVLCYLTLMEKRKLGQSDLHVSAIGLGTWGIGGPPFWSERDEATSVGAIQKAVDLGVNLVDTAPAYGFGLSEELVGKALATRRDEVVIATKCGLRWKGASLKDIYKDLSPGSICQEVEDSLRRLKTDRIDLYQVHWPDQKTP
ncbi:MAG: aldo/keto reductase, partial [Nitrospinota bacterium]|nr:aldo/keto reductase [Nitrospinota bacterium]